MERLILSLRTEIFARKRDFLKGVPKFPNGISEWKCAFHLVGLLVPGLLVYPIFREKVVEMERAHTTEKFHLRFDTYHSLQLSTDRFFRVQFVLSMQV